jgi:hypothetical protein
MSASGEQPTAGERRPPTEEELRAAYEAELKRIRVEEILLEHVVSLVNLGMRRTGLAPGTEDERDPEQVRLAIDGIRAQLPLLERTAGDKVRPIRDALSQLQLAFVKIGGGQGAAPGQGAPEAEQPPSPKPGEPGPAQRSGKLWVPGQ